MQMRMIDGCPCPADIAPYVYRVLRKAGQTATSIYRGEEAKVLLHKHGKRTQAEIFASSKPGIANAPGQSSHELRSDGRAKAGPVGRHLESWEIGVDSGQNTKADHDAIEKAARYYGWVVDHPYKAGIEQHHWHFLHRPRPRNPLQRSRIIAIRARLPRK